MSDSSIDRLFQQKIIIAGPCSAESKEQLYDTAKELKQSGIKVIRAGVWKPRSKPGNFEGRGEEALAWIKEAKEGLGLKFAVEVATPHHVELALKYGIDVLWIGARSTVSPFVVQDLAEALKGTNIPILIKNPVNPDLSLWIGAIERFHNMGLYNVGAVHRGFSAYENGTYRNRPFWDIPQKLREALPTVRIVCDPSHIAGKRNLVADLANKALSFGFDGLMIESHIKPEEALSDAAQQVTPAELGKMLAGIDFSQLAMSPFEMKLETLRGRIDTLDKEMMGMIAARMQMSESVARLKLEHGKLSLSPRRLNELINSRMQWVDELDLLRPTVVEEVLKIMTKAISRPQSSVMNLRSEF